MKTIEPDVHPLNPNFPNMKESIHFNRAQFAELFNALKEDGCFNEDIPQEELIRIFADAVTSDAPEDEVFKSITSTGHFEGFDSDEEEDDFEYIEDDFDEYDDFNEYDEYESLSA